MKIGIIGAGAVAGHHARAIGETEGAVLAGIASRSTAKAEAMAAEHAAHCYAHPGELLADSAIELVIVCTYPDTHGAYAIEAARRGKHVLIEKPLDISLEGAQATIDECRRAGVTLAVVSQKRFCDGPRFLHDAVHNGVLGRILQADSYMKWYRDPAYYARPGKGSWTVEGGGALINQAIHQIDLLRWIVGPVERLKCEWQLGGLHQIESEDSATALLRYRNGAIGVIQASTSFYPGFPDRLEIHGTRGSVITEGDFLKQWDVNEAPLPPAALFKQSEFGSAKPMDISVEPFRRQLQDVIEAIRTGKAPLVSGEEGRDSLALVLAMYCSAREGLEIGACYNQ